MLKEILQYVEVFSGIALGCLSAFFAIEKYEKTILTTKWGTKLIFFPKIRYRPFGLFLILCSLLLILAMYLVSYRSLFLFGFAAGIFSVASISFTSRDLE